MLDNVLDTLDPYIAEIIIGGIMTYFGGVVRVIFRDKQAQKNLHSAVYTGVDMVTDQIARAVSTQAMPDLGHLIDDVVGYVRGSVPDSIKALGADTVTLRKMARAKINERTMQLAQSLR